MKNMGEGCNIRNGELDGAFATGQIFDCEKSSNGQYYSLHCQTRRQKRVNLKLRLINEVKFRLQEAIAKRYSLWMLKYWGYIEQQKVQGVDGELSDAKYV